MVGKVLFFVDGCSISSTDCIRSKDSLYLMQVENLTLHCGGHYPKKGKRMTLELT